MKKVGIVGISGYSGHTALKILLKHPGVRVTYVSANNTQGKVDDIWPDIKGQTALKCTPFDLDKATMSCEVILLAVPHTIAMQLAPELLKAGLAVIDFSGDYRLKDPEQYQQWYIEEHVDKKNLKKAVYGLPELYREEIKKAKLVSNPGCYPTAALLALAPIGATQGKKITSVIIDAKSGVSGAGRKTVTSMMFCEVNGNFKAYKVLNHQHAPEIDLYLSQVTGKPISVNFVPHLLPINNGILETIYVSLKEKTTAEAVHQIYKKFYKTEPFVRLLNIGQQPEIKHVVGTNYCDIAVSVSQNGKLLVITSVIDNLLKGAAGQAVQNMNLMCGFPETQGLK
ncbi:MAG: N-acetyl-gamma-glutamyl-phosphate reductase [Candidatus Omnitrophota bacterium]|nr:N-acetyl-gamma-glutamyl-phosphate reductase [Candidatus Omnitrophota bacterium]